jgi:hypothetical protein
MEIEKDFIDLLTEYKALIYKVCFMYASNQEDLNDLYQEVVVNLWCSYPKFRYEIVYLDISRSFKYLYLGFTEKESTGLCTIERGYRSV